MKFQPGNGAQKKDKSLVILHGEAASSAVETASCAYQSPSVIAAGADAQGVALLSTLTNLVLSVLLIKTPSLIERGRSSLKRTTILIATVSAITWLPIIFTMLFFKQVNPLLLTGLWIVSLVPTTMLFPLRDNWLASIVPGENMGRYLSLRSVISGVCYLTTFYLMGYVLDKAVGLEARSYAFIFAVAFLASAVSVVLYFWVKPPAVPKAVESKTTLNFITFLKEARKSHLGTFILFVSLYTFTVNLAGPLFASYMLGDLKFSYMTFTVIVSCEYITRIISLTFWGKQVDKVGSLKVLSNVTYLIPFVPVLWLFSQNFIYLCGVQMLSGTVWAAFDLGVQTFIYKATPPDQRLKYIVYHRGLTSFSVALGAITGAFLLNHMFKIFGSQILGIFLVSGVLRMVVARIMLPRLTSRGIADAVIHPELALELAAVPANDRTGLYYHPEVWRRFTRRAATVGGQILGRTVGRIAPVRNGLFYKPWRWGEYFTGLAQPVMAEVKGNVRPSHNSLFYKQSDWADYLTRNGIRPVSEANNNTTGPVREGLYNHPEAWEHFHEQNTLESARQTVKRNTSREGLFHNTQQWAEYLKHALVMNATTVRTGSEGVVLRQPVFYHPELWEKYQKETATARVRSTQKASLKDAPVYHPGDLRTYRQTPANGSKTHAPAVVRVIAVGKFRAGDTTPVKEALLYHPEEWQKYEQATARKSKKATAHVGVRHATYANAPSHARAERTAPVTTRSMSLASVKRLTTFAAPA